MVHGAETRRLVGKLAGRWFDRFSRFERFDGFEEFDRFDGFGRFDRLARFEPVEFSSQLY